MIVHLLKLVWHRKRANALIMTEIFFAFLIVFAVVTLAVSLLARWRAPLNFSWQNVWVMDVEPVLREEHSGFRTTIDPKRETRAQKVAAQTDRLIREIRSFPQVESVAADTMPPYSDREWQTVFGVNGRRVLVTADQATDDFARVMNVKLVAGRWFSVDDEGQNYLPIVIDTDAAKAMFGDAEAVGQKFSDSHFGPDEAVHELRVVGVIAPFRQQGEFSSTGIKMMFFRASALHPWDPVANQIVIRVRPGTPASFEAELNRRLHPDSADVTFGVETMENMRRSSMKMRIAPVIALTIIALFLISMVALGLTGVLWQTVTRRMREIGLRRAVGASGSAVRKQVLLEVVVLATMAVAAGTIVIVQLPLLGATRVVSPGQFSLGLAGGIAVIYLITLFCGAYPSWLASTIDPAEALRYE